MPMKVYKLYIYISGRPLQRVAGQQFLKRIQYVPLVGIQKVYSNIISSVSCCLMNLLHVILKKYLYDS